MADTEMLDLGLDEIIEIKIKSSGGGGGGYSGGRISRGGRDGRGSFRGRGGSAPRPLPGIPGARHPPSFPPPPREAVWVPTNRILVSNLAASVTGADIHELFADHGSIRFSALHHDGVGRSLGTADIVFEREEDAQKAIRQYHGVPLDGRPMDIRYIVSVAGINDIAQNGRSPYMVGGSNGGGDHRGARGVIGGRIEKRAPARKSGGQVPTAAELDREMDKYMDQRDK